MENKVHLSIYLIMATIEQLYEAFAGVNLREDLQILILENGTAMAELVESQLIQGKLSTGNSIAPSYASGYYATKKEEMNALPGYGIPDAKVSGDLYAGIGVAIKSEDEYDIESDVEYANNPSILQYGEELLALSDDNQQVFCDDTLGPAIGKYITEKTGLQLI